MNWSQVSLKQMKLQSEQGDAEVVMKYDGCNWYEALSANETEPVSNPRQLEVDVNYMTEVVIGQREIRESVQQEWLDVFGLGMEAAE